MRLPDRLRRFARPKPKVATFMKLNLPIYDHLDDCETILIAGAGGGFDVFAGLPIYFALRERGKTVHLANYSFMDLNLAAVTDTPEILDKSLLIGTNGGVKLNLPYYPEAFLARWFREVHNDTVTVWMFAKLGVKPLTVAYEQLVAHLGGVDAILLVDGGVDSIMRGDEAGAGTLLEDTISIAAVDSLDGVKVKLLACIGFGTEVEEAVCHHHALENIANLTAKGGFFGGCALTPQMNAFQQYEAACRYVWEQPNHAKSHISTRVIPAVNGEFGNHHMYPGDNRTVVFISPLMGLYWFFDLKTVAEQSIILPEIAETYTFQDAFQLIARQRIRDCMRPRRTIPY